MPNELEQSRASTAAVSFHDISMRFGAVRALSNVTFAVRSGQVHGLLGANGAGKSTLLKILSGVYKHGTYDGNVQVRGRQVILKSPDNALRQGIGYVPQEISVIEPLTVAENIYVGRVGVGGTPWVSRRELYRRAQRLLDANGISLSARSALDLLAASQRQLVMIARALALDPAVLILDEATACLTDRETDNLFELVRGFRARGLTTIFVTHRLREVEALADRVTVLRDGKVADEFDRDEISNDRMVKAMVGKTLSATIERARSMHRDDPTAADILTVKGLTIAHPRIAKRNVVEDVSLHVRAGEIVGLAGVVGAGRTEVLSAIYGRLPYTGQVHVGGRPVRIRSPRDAHDLGIGLLTEERKKDGLLFNLPLFKNITLSALPHVSRRGLFLDDITEQRAASGLFEKLAIRAPSQRVAPATLSGGNQQKVILGRLLLAKPRLLMLDEPTKGVDVGAKAEIYKLLFELAQNGIGMLVVSSELPELLTLCDRVIVLARGRITDEMNIADATEQRIMLASTGQAPTRPAHRLHDESIYA
jgi:ABC-type sugar transport system ATPase subunit